jgi:hypothetical protein
MVLHWNTNFTFGNTKMLKCSIFLALTLCSANIEHFIATAVRTSNPYKYVDEVANPKYRYHTIHRQIKFKLPNILTYITSQNI